ncbi:unnamed protein product [Brassica rapa subsp. narinosa]
MCVKNAPIIASFNPKRGPLIVFDSLYILDNFWDRAMRNPTSRPSVSLAPGHAQLWRLSPTLSFQA